MNIAKDNKKQFANTFLLVILYAAIYYTLQFFLYKTGMVQTMPDRQNLLFWDAGWYHGIMESGYFYFIPRLMSREDTDHIHRH